MKTGIGRGFVLGFSGMVWLLMQAGCATAPPQDRLLRITEVAEDRIELYLDEPASRTLHLGGGMRLWTQTGGAGAGAPAVLNFAAAGQVSMRGGEFFMVWEDRQYSGPPVQQAYSGGQSGAVPGIKVARNFLGKLKDFPAEVGLGGTMSVARRVIVVFPEVSENRVSDVVRFGAPATDRPHSAGAGPFTENGMLDNPTGSTSLQRRWSGSGGRPVDTDHESDWRRDVFSWGVQTP